MGTFREVARIGNERVDEAPDLLVVGGETLLSKMRVVTCLVCAGCGILLFWCNIVSLLRWLAQWVCRYGPLVWSARSLPITCRVMHAVRNHALLLGLDHIWRTAILCCRCLLLGLFCRVVGSVCYLFGHSASVSSCFRFRCGRWRREVVDFVELLFFWAMAWREACALKSCALVSQGRASSLRSTRTEM